MHTFCCWKLSHMHSLSIYIENHNNEIKYLYDGQCYVINSTRKLSNITQYFSLLYGSSSLPSTAAFAFSLSFSLPLFFFLRIFYQFHGKAVASCRFYSFPCKPEQIRSAILQKEGASLKCGRDVRCWRCCWLSF